MIRINSIFRKHRFQVSITLWFLLVIVFLFGIFYNFYKNNNTLLESNRQIAHTKEVLLQTEYTSSDIEDIESSTIGFLNSRENLFLHQYNGAKASVFDHIDTLYKLTTHNVKQHEKVDRLSKLVNLELINCNNQITSKQANNSDQPNVKNDFDEGSDLMNEINGIIHYIQKTESRELISRNNDNKWRQFNSGKIVFILGLSIVFILIIVIILIEYTFLKRRKAEETLIALNSELELRVDERTEQIEKNEKLFRALVENDFGLISLQDKSGNIIYRGQHNETVTGWTREERQNIGLQNLVHPDYIDYYNNKMKDVFNNPETPIRLEFMSKHKSGKYIWLEGIILNKLNDPDIKGIISNLHNITERKEAENSLENNVKLFRAMVENTKDIISLTDKNGLITYVSPSYEKLTGFELKDILGKTNLIAIHPDNLEDSKATFNRLMNNPGMVVHRTSRFRNKEGNYIDVEGTVTNLLHDESVQSIVANYRDVSERKRSEERLLQSEKKYRHIFENNPMPMWISDKVTYKFIDVNQAAVRHYGYSREEFLSISVLDLRPEEDKVSFLNTSKGLGPGSHQLGVRKHLKKDGSVTYMEISLSEIIYQGRVVRLVLASDVTAKREAEEKLEQSEKRYRHIFLKNPMPMWITDKYTFKFIAVNEATIKNYGYSKEEFKNMSLIDIRPDEDQAAFINIDHSISANNVNRGVWRHKKKDGGIINAEVIVNEILFEGKPFNLVLANDVTTKVEAEQRMLKMNEELEGKISNRTSELLAANAELESFTYSVSHDLRAPLRSIDGFTKVLKEKYISGLDAEANRYMNIVTNNTEKMAQLIDDLLMFSRVGKQNIQKTELDMNIMVNNACVEVMRQYPSKNPELILHPLHNTFGDESTIKQVLVNLISNAFKYSSKKEYQKIEIDSYQENDSNVYRIKDNGAGFDMDYYDKLFEVFQRLHGTKEFEGTGVGLSIVKKIISKHGGKVWAEGKVNEGATFYFSLPNNSIKTNNTN